MKKIRNKTIILFLSLSILLCPQCYHYNKEKVEINILNSKKITKDMSKERVLEIMGKPDTILDKNICYQTDDESYPWIEISFDSLGKIKGFHSPVKTLEQKKW